MGDETALCLENGYRSKDTSLGQCRAAWRCLDYSSIVRIWHSVVYTSSAE